MDDNIIRQRISFRGWVQGVGFRYISQHAALSEKVTGWVRNEYDGSVTMEIQGTRAQIDKVLSFIDNTRHIHVDSIDCRVIPLVPKEKGFRIRY